jgi:DmsE family decaheme c-type cytochrome
MCATGAHPTYVGVGGTLMNRPTLVATLGLLLAALGFTNSAHAGGATALPDLGSTPPSSAKIASSAMVAVRTCTKCHDESEGAPILSILKSKHAVMADSRTPFAEYGCMGCHGSSKAHLQSPPAGSTKRAPPDVAFDRDSPTPVAKRNEICLGCHESGMRMHWKGSRHESETLACTSCHVAHVQNDPVLAKTTQANVCLTCHKSRRAEMLRPSTHPMRDGQMSCTGCHNPHGSTGPKLLVKETLNETCFTCHAEKRGPFLWEHAPVREDCANCHKPHGSVNASLLKSRTPWLCQQCHLAAQHPSGVYSGTGLPRVTLPSGAQQLLGKNCMNCHSEVHGSNHPSGVRKTR